MDEGGRGECGCCVENEIGKSVRGKGEFYILPPPAPRPPAIARLARHLGAAYCPEVLLRCGYPEAVNRAH